MLDRDEYIEQAYFFRVLSERIQENIPMQELFRQLREEVLSTTKLPFAIDYLLSELKLTGYFGSAMSRLGHYFSQFQTYVVQSAEDERGRFDMRVALQILLHLAEFTAKSPSPQAIFLYQFEVLCRNRLGYEDGLTAMGVDPIYSPEWREWITYVRRQIGILGLADMIYVRSEYYLQQQARAKGHPIEAPHPVLFQEKEGKIALANRRKDPLLLFSALQRHLSYPQVPRLVRPDATPELIPHLMRRMERLEARLKLMEEEQTAGIDITKFYGPGAPPG